MNMSKSEMVETIKSLRSRIRDMDELYRTQDDTRICERTSNTTVPTSYTVELAVRDAELYAARGQLQSVQNLCDTQVKMISDRDRTIDTMGARLKSQVNTNNAFVDSVKSQLIAHDSGIAKKIEIMHQKSNALIKQHSDQHTRDVAVIAGLRKQIADYLDEPVYLGTLHKRHHHEL
jgi:hypothetical protein